MTTAEFTNLLKDPNQLNKMSYETLDNLLLQFPYCNSIRMLLLKKYKNDKHIAFERHLTLASMYASDRSRLYDFLNSSVVAPANTKVIGIHKKQLDEEKKTKKTTQLVSPPPIYYHKVSENPPVLAFQAPLSVEELNDAERVTDAEQHEEDRSLSAMPIEEWLQDFEPPRIEEKNTNHKKSFKLSRIPIFDKGMFDFLETEDPQVSARKKQKPKKKSKQPIAKVESSTAKEDAFSEIKKLEKEETLAFENLEQIYEENAESTDVFDLFLSQTNGFLKSLENKREGKEASKVEEDWEDESTTEDEEVASETLADLLALQGQKIKAIKMYETLSLKFPEKSRLFADKITELQ